MTTTHASTQAPKPTEAAKPSQQGQSARPQGDKAVPADLFANLLSLVSDTHLGPTAPSALEGDMADDKAPGKGKAKGKADDTDPNPLATLLAWATPATAATATTAGATTADAKAAAGADAQAGLLKTAGAEGAGKDSGVDISGMARVDEPAPQLSAQARAASRPAFSPLNPQTAAAVASAAQSQRASNSDSSAAPGSAPAMVWQRGAVSGTEALQQQHSAQFAQVRATAAINERLGLVGAPADATAGPANLREFALGAGGGTSNAAAPGTAATQDTSLAGAASASSADAGGSGDNSSSSASTDQGQGDGHPHASAEAEAPTVSHWGTQHLRHASLRVGGEGGSDAIDIQLAVKGQEVQVAFQTDNAEARATLRESAGASLADLMQRSGIQLGGVSVGSQGASQGDGGHSPRPAGLSTEALGRTARATEPASRPAAPPRADGSRPLDVFA